MFFTSESLVQLNIVIRPKYITLTRSWFCLTYCIHTKNSQEFYFNAWFMHLFKKNRIDDILHLVILFHFKSQWVSHNTHPLGCSIFYRRTVPTLRRRILCILRKDGSLTGFLKQHLIITVIKSWLCGHELKMNRNSLHAKSRAWISLHGILNFLAIQ